MYYDLNKKAVRTILPQKLIKSDGSLIANFNTSNEDVLSDYGYYTIRSDNNIPPTPTSIEIESAQKVTLDKPYADIVRVWLETKTAQSITIQKQKIVENILDDDILN